jgi:CBS domain-containing protein
MSPGGEISMKAADVMTTEVISVTPETSIITAADLMLQRRIGGLLVIDDFGKLAGIVSEGDLLLRIETETERKRPRWLELFTSNAQLAAEYVKSHSRHVGDVMTRDVVTVSEDTSLGDVAELLETKRIKRVPVVCDGEVVGIVTQSDILRAVASSAALRPTMRPGDDYRIREAILTELKKQKWADPNEINVVVNDGAVHLWGIVLSQAERQALRVVAENVPGARAVEDHLTERPVHYDY